MTLFKYTLMNMVGITILIAMQMQGHLDSVKTADTTGLVWLIVALWLVGMVQAGYRARQLDKQIALFEQPTTTPDDEDPWFNSPRFVDSENLQWRLSQIRHIASTLTMLGLIGTVLGFIIALSGVDPETVSDVDAIPAMVATLLEGMSIALYTTLVGSVLAVWTLFNYRILYAGAVQLQSL